MLALGIRRRTIIAGAVAESTLIGVLGTAIGLVGGWFTLGWVIDVTSRTVPEVGLDPRIDAGTVGVTLLLGIVAVGLAPIALTRRVGRIDIPSSIRTVE